MASSGTAIVIMGVSGCGKSTIAESLAKYLSCNFIEADDYHSSSNKEKMRNGVPLSDSDRIPWLESLRDLIKQNINNSKNVTISCSALKIKYREILRLADCNYNSGNYKQCRVKFICLEAPIEVIVERMRRRYIEGNHFMPVSLLQSQFDLLQIDDEEEIVKIDATVRIESIIEFIVDLYNKNWND